MRLSHFDEYCARAWMQILFGLAGTAMTILLGALVFAGESEVLPVALISVPMAAWLWYECFFALRYRVNRWVQLDDAAVGVSDWNKGPEWIPIKEIVKIVSVQESWALAPRVVIVHAHGLTEFPPQVGLGKKSNLDALIAWCERTKIPWISYAPGEAVSCDVFQL